MGLRDWLDKRRLIKRHIKPEIKQSRDSYAKLLKAHGYSDKTAKAEAKKRIPITRKKKRGK